MPKQAPVGVGNYRELSDPANNYLFVDRTEQLPLLIGSEKVTAIHTFRRSGKSLFASMAAHFFAECLDGLPTQGLFDSLAIGQHQPEFVQAHQGQYPVIFISLKGVNGQSVEQACDELRQILRTAYEQHDYLLSSTRLSANDQKKFKLFYDIDSQSNLAQLQTGLLGLTELLYKHHGNQGVMVILDEYDAPLVNAHLNGYLDDFTPIYKQFLSNALKDNSCLKKGLLLGILRIARESILSGLNNPKVYSLLNPGPYQPYFGFTEDEVISLFEQAGLNQPSQAVKHWYNGYNINEQSLYNPWSVVNCLADGGKLKPYWVNTASDKLLKQALLNAPINAKQKFEQLITSTHIISVPLTELVRFEDLNKDEKSLWGLLYQTGYLTAKQQLHERRAHYHGELMIPNEEIKGLYIDFFADWLANTFDAQHNDLLQSLITGDIEQFSQHLQDFLHTHASSRNLHYEASYHNLILGLIAGLFDSHYVFSDTLESGAGYSDLMIIPREHSNNSLAIIAELKIVKATEDPHTIAQTGLAQINQANYAAKINLYPQVKQLLKVGLAFAGKSVYFISEQQIITTTNQ